MRHSYPVRIRWCFDLLQEINFHLGCKLLQLSQLVGLNPGLISAHIRPVECRMPCDWLVIRVTMTLLPQVQHNQIYWLQIKMREQPSKSSWSWLPTDFSLRKMFDKGTFPERNECVFFLSELKIFSQIREESDTKGKSRPSPYLTTSRNSQFPQTQLVHSRIVM